LAGAPLCAQPEHGVLPGRVRRPRFPKGYADRLGDPRNRDETHGCPGLCGRLFHRRAVPGRRHRSLADAAAVFVAGGLYRDPGLFRAPAAGGFHGPGRRPRADDRPDRRQLYQYPDDQAVRPYTPRTGLCPGCHERIHDHRSPADAPRHPADPLPANRQRAAAGRHRRGRDLCVVSVSDHAGGDRGRHRFGHADPVDVGMGALGNCRVV